MQSDTGFCRSELESLLIFQQVIKLVKRQLEGRAVVAHTFKTSTPGAEAGRSLFVSLRLAWSTKRGPSKSGLRGETLVQRVTDEGHQRAERDGKEGEPLKCTLFQMSE